MTEGGKKVVIALWGATSAGKSTALAAYSSHCEPTWIRSVGWPDQRERARVETPLVLAEKQRAAQWDSDGKGVRVPPS